jgi:hypothetical protein
VTGPNAQGRDSNSATLTPLVIARQSGIKLLEATAETIYPASVHQAAKPVGRTKILINDNETWFND